MGETAIFVPGHECKSSVAPSDVDRVILGYRLIWGYRVIGGNRLIHSRSRVQILGGAKRFIPPYNRDTALCRDTALLYVFQAELFVFLVGNVCFPVQVRSPKARGVDELGHCQGGGLRFRDRG